MDRLNDWVSLLVNIGVLAGLGFLIVEVSQNTRAITNESDVAIHSLSIQTSLSVSESEYLPDLLVSAVDTEWHEFNQQERERLSWFFAATVETASLQYKLYKRNGEPIENIVFPETLLDTAAWEGYWELDRDTFSPDFVSYLDETKSRRAP